MPDMPVLHLYTNILQKTLRFITNCLYEIQQDDLCLQRGEMTAEELWRQSGLSGTYESWAFGDAPDKLAALVRNGVKTAACSAYDLYEAEGEPLPKEGDYSVILDSKGDAVCIIKTVKVYVAEFHQVSEEHAYKEGEGDRSLEYWRKVHIDFLTRELERLNLTFTENTKVVCEEFELVSV